MVRDNPLERYFEAHRGRQIHKWVHYWDIYHRHLKKYRGTPVVVVEFGIQYGGSSQMWREYFGPDAKIYGVDIDPRCKAWEEESFQVFIGDQGDPDFLRRIADEIGPVDVVIEDGGHFPLHQITTFEVFYPRIRRGGVFLIEDLHTSYWKDYGGKLGQPGTFMEYAKALTDKLNAWHSEEPDFAPDRFTRSTRSMHFYDSIVVFEKGKVVEPHHEVRGTPEWTDTAEPFEYSDASKDLSRRRRAKRAKKAPRDGKLGAVRRRMRRSS